MNENTWWISHTENLMWSVEWAEDQNPTAAQYQVDVYGDIHEMGHYKILPMNWEYMMLYHA